MKTFLIQIVLYIAISYVQSHPDSSTVPTVTFGPKKIVSSDLPEDYHLATVSNAEEIVSSATTKTPSDVEISHVGSQDSVKLIPSSDSNDDFTVKPHKIKKKILVSNLKNVSDKIILPSDKYDKPVFLRSIENVTESEEAKINSTTPVPERVKAEPENVVEASSENIKITERSDIDQDEETESKIEGKSEQVADSRSFKGSEPDEGSINASLLRSKNKISFSTTESSREKLTTNNYYRTLSEFQKVLNNNFLNINEGYETSIRPKPSSESIRPSFQTTANIPELRSTSISNDFRNAIRFENEYPPTGSQSDWVPIVPENISGPERLPITPFSTTPRYQHHKNIVQTTTEKPFITTLGKTIYVTTDKGSNLDVTTERQRIFFPNEKTTQRPQESNFIPVQGSEADKSATSHQTTSESNNIDGLIRPTQHYFNKYRGNVRYKSPQTTESSSTTKLNGNQQPSSNAGLVNMELPPTGVSWALATLGGPMMTRFTRKPSMENSTMLTKSDSNNFIRVTESPYRRQNISDTSKEVVNSNNVTREQSQVLKNTIPDTIPSDVTPSVSKYNDTRINLSKIVVTSKSWTPESEVTTSAIETTTDGSFNEISSKVVTRSEAYTKNVETSSPTESIKFLTEETTLPTVSTRARPKLSTRGDYSDVERTTPYEILRKTTAESAKSPSTPLFELSSQVTTERSTEIPMTSVRTKTVTTEEIPITTSVKEIFYTTISDDNVPVTTLRVNVPDDVDINTEGSTESEITTLKHVSSVDFEPTKTTPKTGTSFIPKTSTTSKPSTTSKSSTTSKPISTTSKSGSTSKPRTTTTTTTAAATTTVKMTATTRKQKPDQVKPTLADTNYKINITKPEESSEEGIYYHNYVPISKYPHDDITEENVTAYLRLTVRVPSWKELCRLKEDLRNSIIKMLQDSTDLDVSVDNVHFLNLNEKHCHPGLDDGSRPNVNLTMMLLPVNLFLMDKNGDFNKNLSEAFLTIWGRDGLDFELPILKVDFVTPIVEPSEIPDNSLGGSVVAAIVISCVAGVCVILLGVLFVVMKRRQKRFNYGQRCTPVSLDAYSLDSVSIHNSVRRKGIRASKRSYGNAAFDDPEVPSHPMNFAGLANFSSDKEQLFEEFNIIPQVSPKTDELPAGAETKNRYANVIPLPETRVHLSVKDGDKLSDYINANYVRGPKGVEKLYIACQAPMDSTVDDFWRMVWEQQSKVIIMLTDLQENGVEKCADYLPPSEVTDNTRLFGDFQITLKKRDVKEKYIISYLKIKNMEANLWREVTHLWYLGWPEQGVPSEANSLIAFLIEARSQMKTQSGSAASGPAVVHCSPGTGRTGTVIACDLCIREFEQTRMVDIPKCVFNLRRDRAGAVQTKDQYAFIYQVLNLYATKLTGGGLESI